MDYDQLSRRTRRAGASLTIVSTATILSLVHNIKFSEAEILSLTINVTEAILFQLYTIVIVYFLYFFLFYCYADYAENSGGFFSYVEANKKRYRDFFEDKFRSLTVNLIMKSVEKSVNRKPSEEGPNSNSNIIAGLETHLVRCTSEFISKNNTDIIWTNRAEADKFVQNFRKIILSDMELRQHVGEIDFHCIRNLVHSLLEDRKNNLTEFVYPPWSKFHLCVLEISLPVLLGFLALWINLGFPYSSVIVNMLMRATNLLHSPI